MRGCGGQWGSREGLLDPGRAREGRSYSEPHQSLRGWRAEFAFGIHLPIPQPWLTSLSMYALWSFQALAD